MTDDVKTVLAEVDAKLAEIDAVEKRITDIETRMTAQPKPVRRKVAHRCPVCSKLFSTKDGMLLHVERKHDVVGGV